MQEQHQGQIGLSLQHAESAIPAHPPNAVHPPKPLDTCVICLDAVSERAIAVPCNHCNFDFICIVTWLQGNSACPLCKSTLTAVQYDWRTPDDFKTYTVPSAPLSASISTTPLRHVPSQRARRPSNRYQPYRPSRLPQHDSSPTPDRAISQRRYVYRHNLYSLHVGSNRLSCFKDFTPQTFSHSTELQSRARKWIRRELQVFDFLGLANERQTSNDRRANNTEFLLEYIMAIVRTVDLKSSSGRAQEMLQEFLGEANAPLFLHELGAWLRSPYSRLEDWDSHVQYRVALPGTYSEPEQQEADTAACNTPSSQRRGYSNNAQAGFERFRRQGIEARKRYEPD